jgi:hypothetical protein
MRLVTGVRGHIIDIDQGKKCAMCLEWFHPEHLQRGYCSVCRTHYQCWRHQQLRFHVKHPALPCDATVPTFRELYMSGVLDMKPWTWPGETSLPLGYLDPGLLG